MDLDDMMVGRLFSRREAIAKAAQAGLVLVSGPTVRRLAGPMTQSGPKPVHIVVSPELTEGPFFVDERLNRSNLLSGTKRETVIDGLPLRLSLTVYRRKGAGHVPLKGAHVDVWHADAAGVYSDISQPMNHENTQRQAWLRGFQVTDAEGGVQFATIFPGWYEGRAPHIHFKVRNFSIADKVTAEFTSQLFFHNDDAKRIYANEPYASHGRHDTTNEYDNVYNDFQVDEKPAGSLMLLHLAPNTLARGYQAHFGILVDDSNMHAPDPNRRRFGPPPGGPPPGPPPDDWGG